MLPSTASSASILCGGTRSADESRSMRSIAIGVWVDATSVLCRLHVNRHFRGDVSVNLDSNRVTTDVSKRLAELDLPLVEVMPPLLTKLFGNVRRGDRAVQTSLVAHFCPKHDRLRAHTCRLLARLGLFSLGATVRSCLLGLSRLHSAFGRDNRELA